MATSIDTDIPKTMFGPLSFEESPEVTAGTEQPCVLCDGTFSLKPYDAFLKHIFDAHNLVIDSVQEISKLDRYVNYWKTRFSESPIESVVPNVRVGDTESHYFVLSTLLKEDKEIRHKLKLESVLEQQEYERTSDDFKRNCLFCKLQFEGKRVDFVKHLATQHNIHLGKPENLVYISELLDKIENQINNLRCMYCEKTFTDRTVLKEHMRKRLHKQIKPSNHSYDKFYIVNYLEVDRNWQDIEKEDDTVPATSENSDQEWSDWNERDQEIFCLFCDHKDFSIANIFDHMKYGHGFDFKEIIKDMDFYQKVKLVNYIRRQLHVCRCVYCDKHFESKEHVREHLRDEKHCKVPDTKTFDQPEYYFPTYENDTLLYYLEEINEN